MSELMKEVLSKGKERVNNFKNGGGTTTAQKGFNYSLLYKIPLGLVVIILVVMYLATGFYAVQPKEVGVVTRFGCFQTMTEPGLHYRLPFPFEAVQIVNVTDVRRVEIGYVTVKSGSSPTYQSVPEEALMLTRDLSIVSVEATVLYGVKNAADFIFKTQHPENAVKTAAEAVLRQIVGKKDINDILTVQKMEIQAEARIALQQVLDLYETGIMVEGVLLQEVDVPEKVQKAYRDVASAKEDKQKRVNEADAYKNQIIPKARGEAVKILNEAEAYKATRIAQAQGDVVRFQELYEYYKLGKEVTRTRLYLETMEKILPQMNKIIISEESAGVLKFLNLEQGKGGE